MFDINNIKFNYNIDDKLKNSKIKFRKYDFPNENRSKPNFKDDSVEVDLDTIHRLNPIYNSDEIHSCILFWDDICQFTTLGALDLFKELVIDTYEKEKNIKEEDKFEFEYFHEEFFGRTNDLIDTEKFMYIALNSIYSLTQLKRFYKKFYNIILTKSPMSGIIPAIGSSIHMIKRVIIVFNFKLSEEIKQRLKKDLYEYWDIKQIAKEIIITDLETVDENEIYDSYRPSAIFTRKANVTLAILLKINIKNVDIFTHVKHNGLSEDFLENYVYKLKMTIAPGFNKIYFYDDQIHIDEPNLYEELYKYQENNNKR